MQRHTSFVLLVSTLSLLLGCGPSRNDPPGDAPDASTDTLDCLSVPKVQGPSQECCPRHGADACGANLFCAAFDGRTVPTCYVLGTRLPGRECLSSEQCSTQSCNLETGKCRPILGLECDEATGCVDALCDEGMCVAPIGSLNSRCAEDAHCNDGMACVKGRCGDPNGARCETILSSHCASRLCVAAPNSSYGKCTACATSDDCATTIGSPFERCVEGRCIRTCRDDYHCQVLSGGGSPFVCVKSGGGKDGLCQ